MRDGSPFNRSFGQLEGCTLAGRAWSESAGNSSLDHAVNADFNDAEVLGLLSVVGNTVEIVALN
jgi:hypothetical protein